jgi:hypothetical protein
VTLAVVISGEGTSAVVISAAGETSASYPEW